VNFYLKNFSRIVILSSLFILLIIGSFNYLIDPLWNFSHSNKFNQYQMGLNERQSKTNVVYFKDFKYNALMLGTSRVTYINRHDIKDYNSYNYAVAKMRPYEYIEYTKYAKSKNKKDFDMIFLGIDFSSAEIIHEKKENFYKYKNETESFLYRYKTLFSLDTLKYSIKNFKNFAFDKYKKRIQTYTRDMIVQSYPKDKDFINHDIAAYLSDATKIYDPSYKIDIQKLKDDNPNTKFYVFLTPLTEPRFRKIMSNPENIKFYKRWVRDTIDVFGEVYNFMTINNVTKNYTKTFTGVSHFYPFVGTHIVNKVFGYKDNDPFYKDFGVKITKNNFDYEINNIIKSLNK